jgi:2-polyprenyl-6-methoxyphenol hydroxylase-like FAD-dependent oxidoreductase
VPAEAIRLGRRATEVRLAGERPVLRFSDGELVTPDVLIGADGIHSMVRAAVAESVPATYSGLCAFRGLVPAGQAPGGQPRAGTRQPPARRPRSGSPRRVFAQADPLIANGWIYSYDPESIAVS